MAWKTLDDMELRGRRVLTRVDINVPVEHGRVTDTTRIDRIVPTVKDILEAGGKPILLAHFDRPKGKVVPEMTLRQIVPALQDALGHKVIFAGDCIGPQAHEVIDALEDGEVALLENTRFHPGEEKNDPGFARKLAANGDVYCNDAFSAAHRAHASTEALAHLLPACAGRLMAEELSALDAALGNPRRPVVAIVGGAKVSTKLDLLANLVDPGRHAGDRRRHGEHLPRRDRHRRGQLALRARPGADRARDRRQGGGRRLHHPSAARRGRRARASEPGAERGRSRPRTCPPT